MEQLDWEQLLHVLTLQGVSGPPVAPGLLNSLQQLQLEAPLQPTRGPEGKMGRATVGSQKRKAGGPPKGPSRSQSQRQQLEDSRELDPTQSDSHPCDPCWQLTAQLSSQLLLAWC